MPGLACLLARLIYTLNRLTWKTFSKKSTQIAIRLQEIIYNRFADICHPTMGKRCCFTRTSDGPCETCMAQEEEWKDRVVDEIVAYNNRFQI